MGKDDGDGKCNRARTMGMVSVIGRVNGRAGCVG
jgi:hypothetical protein